MMKIKQLQVRNTFYCLSLMIKNFYQTNEPLQEYKIELSNQRQYTMNILLCAGLSTQE